LRTWATLPDGPDKWLLYIGDWNFNWHVQYLYKDYVRLPKGTVVHGEVTWDNSAGNPRNPNTPPVRVRWGEGSTDEMAAVSLMVVAVNESESGDLQSAFQAHVRQTVITSRRRGDEIGLRQSAVRRPQRSAGADCTRGRRRPASQDAVLHGARDRGIVDVLSATACWLTAMPSKETVMGKCASSMHE
jgi:hypothetical protein